MERSSYEYRWSSTLEGCHQDLGGSHPTLPHGCHLSHYCYLQQQCSSPKPHTLSPNIPSYLISRSPCTSANQSCTFSPRALHTRKDFPSLHAPSTAILVQKLPYIKASPLQKRDWLRSSCYESSTTAAGRCFHFSAGSSTARCDMGGRHQRELLSESLLLSLEISHKAHACN